MISSSNFTQSAREIEIPYGLIIAGCIITLWAVSLVSFLCLNVAQVNTTWIVLVILWQTFLYTGLFITAHDAMHGVVTPHNPTLNRSIGSLALTVYGLFSFKQLLKKHWEHHNHPASNLDPDFHDGQHKNFFAWYFHFMKGYWSWSRLLGLIAIYNAAYYFLHVPKENLTLFWIIPSLLSSVQLFYFGTFLPHREPVGGYQDQLRAQSSYRSILWSFLTCYHFGYHREHHEKPQLPWWQLPMAVKAGRN